MYMQEESDMKGETLTGMSTSPMMKGSVTTTRTWKRLGGILDMSLWKDMKQNSNPPEW